MYVKYKSIHTYLLLPKITTLYYYHTLSSLRRITLNTQHASNTYLLDMYKIWLNQLLDTCLHVNQINTRLIGVHFRYLVYSSAIIKRRTALAGVMWRTFARCVVLVKLKALLINYFLRAIGCTVLCLISNYTAFIPLEIMRFTFYRRNNFGI